MVGVDLLDGADVNRFGCLLLLLDISAPIGACLILASKQNKGECTGENASYHRPLM